MAKDESALGNQKEGRERVEGVANNNSGPHRDREQKLKIGIKHLGIDLEFITL